MVASGITLGQCTPILRMFDVAKAQEFYVEYLGFRIDSEHRFGDGMPLYIQISRGSCVIHLSEHHGDACPGSAVRIPVHNITALHEQLTATGYAYARPGLETTPWNTREITIIDPFGNRIVLFEAIGVNRDTE